LKKGERIFKQAFENLLRAMESAEQMEQEIFRTL